jgi:hypothetical protein
MLTELNEKEITSLLCSIREQSETNQLLQDCHHFLFALPIKQSNNVRKVLLMGFNPGETIDDIIKTNGKKAEESFELNFHQYDRSKSSARWMNLTNYFIEDADILMTEYIFWSSPNIIELARRIGKISPSHELVVYCTNLNQHLIKIIRPDLIVVTGLANYKDIAASFLLREVGRFKDISGHNIWIQAESADNTWLFTKHWTGSFGFSLSQREVVRNKIKSLLSVQQTSSQNLSTLLD